MGEIGRLIDEYRDRIGYRIPDKQIAEKLDVQRSTVGNWVRGTSMPKPANLVQLAVLIGQPYSHVLDAALADAGYLARESEHRGYTAPMYQAPVSGAPRVTEEEAEVLAEGRRGGSRSPQRRPPGKRQG